MSKLIIQMNNAILVVLASKIYQTKKMLKLIVQMNNAILDFVLASKMYNLYLLFLGSRK